MKFAGRFAAVALLVTTVDVAIVLTLATQTSAPLWLADVAAVLAATVVSYGLHRGVSYSFNPARRWYRNLRHYAQAVGLALMVDVFVFASLASAADRSVEGLLVPKFAAIFAAAVLRVLLYRRVMFATVRGDQSSPKQRPAPAGEHRLSLVVPAFGEQDAIGDTVRAVLAELGELDGGFELVVVDDGSPDDTAQAARDAGAHRVIRLEQNSGKGAAVRAGVLASSGRTVAFTDADLSYAPSQLYSLLDEVERGWDVVAGSRKHTETSTLVAAGRLREIGGRVINAFTWAVLLGQYRDTQCGLKAFRGDVAELIFSRSQISGFAFDVEVFHLVERYRLRLVEVPVEVVNSSRSTVNVARDAVRLVRDLFRIRSLGRSGAYEVTPEDLAAIG